MANVQHVHNTYAPPLTSGKFRTLGNCLAPLGRHWVHEVTAAQPDVTGQHSRRDKQRSQHLRPLAASLPLPNGRLNAKWKAGSLWGFPSPYSLRVRVIMFKRALVRLSWYNGPSRIWLPHSVVKVSSKTEEPPRQFKPVANLLRWI